MKPREQTILEQLWDHLPDIILVVDKEGFITHANPAGELLGYCHEELIGLSVDQLVPLKHRDRHSEKRHSYISAPYSRAMAANLPLEAARKDGNLIPVDIALRPIEIDGNPCVLAVVRDASERRKYENHIRELTFHDPVTGLHNRAYFEDQIRRLEGSRMYPIGVVMIDLDGLKVINDTEGHEAGDAALQQAGRILSKCVRQEDLICRIGGDEFALVFPAVEETTLQSIIKRIKREVEGRVALSLGGSLAESGSELRGALQEADDRMYENKRQRRGSLQRLTPGSVP